MKHVISLSLSLYLCHRLQSYSFKVHFKTFLSYQLQPCKPIIFRGVIISLQCHTTKYKYIILSGNYITTLFRTFRLTGMELSDRFGSGLRVLVG